MSQKYKTSINLDMIRDRLVFFCGNLRGRGNNIKVSVSVCHAGRPGWSRYGPFVSERRNSTNMLLTCLNQCRQLVHQRPSMCYHVCVIMHVKDPQLSVIRVGHFVPLAGLCLSLYSLHALIRDVNMIKKSSQIYIPPSLVLCAKVLMSMHLQFA